MVKLLRKIIPTIVLSAVIMLVGGFCDGLIASASNRIVNEAPITSSCFNNEETTATPVVQASAQILHKNGLPQNAVLPCCIDRHNSVPTTQTINYNFGVKFAVIDQALQQDNPNLFCVNKISKISDSSPPKTDILSSVLKKE